MNLKIMDQCFSRPFLLLLFFLLHLVAGCSFFSRTLCTLLYLDFFCYLLLHITIFVGVLGHLHNVFGVLELCEVLNAEGFSIFYLFVCARITFGRLCNDNKFRVDFRFLGIWSFLCGFEVYRKFKMERGQRLRNWSTYVYFNPFGPLKITIK